MMMTTKKVLLSVLFALLAATTVASAQPYQNSSVVGQVPDRIVITVRPDVAMTPDKSGDPAKVGVPALDALASRFAVRGMDQMYAGMTGNLSAKSARDYFDRVWAVDFPAELDIHKVKEAYEALPEVEEVRLVDICRQYAYLPDDIAGAQYYLRNMNLGGGDIRAVGAWNQSLGDSNVIVAILDSGVDWHHPDLGGAHPDKVNGAVWTNWTEYYGTAGVDDDSNGKIDDIRGWDFVNTSASNGWPDEDVTVADNDPMDYESHGTSCAGAAAAITNNGIGIAGAAPGCKIMAIRAGYLPDGEDLGVVRMDWASAGILYATNNGASIINCSWGSSDFLAMAVTTAQSEGLLLVTAAGNDNSSSDPSYLSTRSGVLSVAATETNDGKSSFSNYGTWVEISAPGSNIYTTVYNRLTQTSTYGAVSGTSFSSPITAGAAALLWSANPGYSYTQIANLLTSSADNIDDINPAYAGLLGAGRVNMLKALGDNMHRYPDEFPTIFDAINEAALGDTIGVAGGEVLTGPITVLGKDLKFFGGYSSDFATRDPLGNPSVINGTVSATGLKFQGDVTNATEVDGFVIQNGRGQTYSGIPYSARYGGGVMLNFVSPTLRNLEITANSVGDASQLGCGGGLAMNGSTAMLENVSIHGNTGIYGSGLFVYNSTPTLINCSVQDNVIIGDNLTYLPKGGGIHALDTQLTMEDCVVSGHLDLVEGGGMYVGPYSASSSLTMVGGEISGNTAKDFGGGLYHAGGTLTLTSVTFDQNDRTGTSTFMYGGAFYVNGATSALLDSLTSTGNGAQVGAGGCLTGCADATITNSLHYGNSAVYFGGALAYENNPGGSITGNTFVENAAAASGGGGLLVNSSAPAVENNISAFNTGGTTFGNGMALNSVPASLACNDVFGNDGVDYSGQPDPTGTDGNISVDPLFCSQAEGKFNLSPTSPCAPDNSGSCGLIGALPAGCGEIAVPDEGDAVPMAFRVEDNFPNPFNPKTTIRFTLPEAGMTRVSIYDVAGRHVKTLVQEVLPAQSHEVTWLGRDGQDRHVAAGVYFYMVTSGQHRAVGRMALVK